ncbi:serine endoprotease [Caulifigura coniformis]|uniref:Serine endoprotease n=1 Tax=Caulifigura coniformis TaxID=2527983 RepID=A0A517S9M0_9PLAN|nr:PDZ domain-containing protein [Caulifigura coniformis]QDT52813.1 serine endoprotease [Caulifigura coniformis]
MQSTPRRDPKKFAQRTMAAAIAAAGMMASGLAAQAQTTGGGIGAAVNPSPGAAGGIPTQGTTGTTGGTATSGVASPTAPANPARPGSGPGINNTGSPALPVPRNLQAPIGGATGGPRGANGTSRIPGNTVPRGNAAGAATNGLNGASVPQPTSPINNGPRSNDNSVPRLPGNTRPGVTPTTPNTGVANRRPGANFRTGTITNFTGNSVSFREGANTSTLSISPDTVVQMDGRNITLRDIPANSQVRVERSPSNPNLAQRIVVVPQGTAGGTSVNTQTGTGSTGSANRSLPSNDLNAATPNATTPGNDINAGTANASTPGNDLNAPVANNADRSNRPLAPGRNPADQPLAPFTRGNDQPLQAGFNESNAQGTSQQRQPGTTDSSRFLGPVGGLRDQAGSTSNADPRRSSDTGKNAPVVLPDNAATGQNPRVVDGEPRPDNVLFNRELGNRLGMQMTAAQGGLTVGTVNQQSLAGRSGLLSGDQIRSVNGQPVTTTEDFGRLLQSGVEQGPITASIVRDGAARDVSLSLPNGFFNGLNVPAAVGAGNIAVAPDGTAGVNVGGAYVPATGEVNVGTNAATATGSAAASVGGAPGQAVAQQPAAPRSRPLDPPVGTQRSPITTEALKVPDVDLGWTLKATSEGVVMSSLVDDGLAAKNKLEPGDLIESIDGRPVTSPGAVSYELHRHPAGATVDFTLLRNGRRTTESVTLPESHKPLLLNQTESFGQANNAAKEQGGSGASPVELKPTEESLRRLEAENKALKAELEALRNPKKP